MKKLFIAAIILSSCSTQKKLQNGYYTIKQINGVSVTFNEIEGTYYLPSDTIKVKDKITVGLIKRF